MVDSLSLLGRWLFRARLPLCLAIAFFTLSVSDLPSMAADPSPESATEPLARLLDQQPFDRVTLNAANGNEVIDTLLLDLPNRSVPNPLPADGSLELRRLSEPSVLYTVPWNSIARIELYEQLLLAEAIKLATAKSGQANSANGQDLSQSYEYLNFLHKNYPQLAGLRLATEQYLRRDALAVYAEKDYEATLTILLSLYDLNPKHRGLQKFVERVSDRLIARHLSARDFAAARSVLDMLPSAFPQLRLTNVSTWRGKFEAGAARQLTTARQAIKEERFSKARQALRRALAILPDAAGAVEMLEEIDRKAPQIIVGVDQLAVAQRSPLEWSTARVTQLTEPKILNLVGFGAEGGDYRCPWADLASDDTGLQLDFMLNDAALRQGISAEVLALELLKQADPTQPQYRADFAGLLRNVEIHQGNLVSIHWQRSHVRPEALLSIPLRNVTPSVNPPGIYQPSYQPSNQSSLDGESKPFVTYQLPKIEQQVQGPETIIETFYDNEERAFADLLSGEIDVLASVPPWQVARFQRAEGLVVSSYRLPTIHVLLPNYQRPIMARREFRRALCYGINRPQILNDLLLGGERRPGFRLLSAPLPAGITLTDPVGYAYNQGLQPRPYEPRLAAVLAAVARNSLAKLAAAREKLARQGKDTSEDASEEQDVAPEVQPLVLAHPPSSSATLVCQTIKLQLDAIGIPIKLKPRDPQGADADDDYDLRYAELALWEPIVDARRLLGPHGLAGNCSSSMSLALQDVDQAKNWKDARARLQEVHQLAFNDLQVIPLWQTVNFFAHRQALRGVGTSPVTLYQNIVDWQRASMGTVQGATR
ncbi:MAG: hypothetical protein GXP24_12090 [Planctomycetes bacterium]|nr:hypothetical protein [Planctomycetota bacterium]